MGDYWEGDHMRAVFIQLPYPGDLQADLLALDLSVDTVVIQNTADGNLSLHAQAGIPASMGRFKRIFVGSTLTPSAAGYTPSVAMPTWAADSPYVGAMTNAAYRWRLIAEARTVWDKYLSAHGSEGFGAYISHEASLSTWAGFDWSEAVRGGYEAVIVQMMRDADERNPFGPVLWSPYVWQRYSTDTPSHRAQVFDAVGRTVPRAYNWVREHDHLEPNLVIDLQDGVGAGAARGVTKEDALGWLEGFKAAGLSTIGVNVEAFDGNMQPAADYAQREAWYTANGMRIGASFELRYLP